MRWDVPSTSNVKQVLSLGIKYPMRHLIYLRFAYESCLWKEKCHAYCCYGQIQLHNVNDIPLVSNLGFFVEPGKHSLVTVDYSKVSHVSFSQLTKANHCRFTNFILLLLTFFSVYIALLSVNNPVDTRPSRRFYFNMVNNRVTFRVRCIVAVANGFIIQPVKLSVKHYTYINIMRSHGPPISESSLMLNVKTQCITLTQ